MVTARSPLVESRYEMTGRPSRPMAMPVSSPTVSGSGIRVVELLEQLTSAHFVTARSLTVPSRCEMTGRPSLPMAIAG